MIYRLIPSSSAHNDSPAGGGHSVRSDIAKHLMAGLLANVGAMGSDVPCPEDYAVYAADAVAATDALIAALNKTPPSSNPS